MACPLLEKLAPETRNLIYEYVLTFDAPLKHAQKMQPFINKLYQRSDSETETTSSAGSSDMADTLHRVDTALLSTCKLIFQEAIVTFYEKNVIYLDVEDCEVTSIVSPQATDLSLARQVMMKITDWNNDTKSLCALGNGIHFVREGLPAIFPKLHTATLCIPTDSSESPVQALFAFAGLLHSSSNHDGVVFEGIGSVTARSVSQPRINYSVQCKEIVKSWTNEELEFSRSCGLDQWSARSMYLYSQDGHVHRDAIILFNEARRFYLPKGYPEVAEGSFEFWTIIDQVWYQTRLSMPRMPAIQDIVEYLHNLGVQAAPMAMQLNDASSGSSSGAESGGGEDDAFNSIEQKPKSEPDSVENGTAG